MSAERDLAKAIADAVDAKVAGTSPQSSTMPATYQGRDSEGKGWVLLPGATEPTPVSRMAVEAAQGDTVSVTIANGKATVDSNVSNPSAGIAGVKVVERTANTASATASEALTAASDARTAATSAQASADTARQAANEATADASTARAMAESASSDAATASASAAIAKESADKATFALSDVENVVGTLNWIAEHGEYVLTEDTAIVEGKAYYTRSGTDPDYVYTVVASPVASELSTYYELQLDESVQNYIASHIYLMNDGLYVTTDSATGYKVRIDGDSMDVLDTSGAIVASFGTSIALGKAATRVLYEAGDSLIDGSGMQMTVTANSQTIGRDFFGLADDGEGGDYELRATFVNGDSAPHYAAAARNSTSNSTARMDLDGSAVDPTASLYALDGSTRHYTSLDATPGQISLRSGSWNNDIPTVDAYFGQDGFVCYDEVTAFDSNDNAHNLTEKVDKSGDTMTGDLNIIGKQLAVCVPDIDVANPPSSGKTTEHSMRILDKNGNYIGQLRHLHYADDGIGFVLNARQTSGSSIRQNALGPVVRSDGTRSYIVSDPAAFRTAIGLDDTPSSSTTVSSICTAGTNITVTSANWKLWGRVANVSVTFKPTAAISANTTVFTMASGLEPAMAMNGFDTNSTYPCTFDTNGKVYCRRALTSGTSYTFKVVYIMAG